MDYKERIKEILLSEFNNQAIETWKRIAPLDKKSIWELLEKKHIQNYVHSQDSLKYLICEINDYIAFLNQIIAKNPTASREYRYFGAALTRRIYQQMHETLIPIPLLDIYQLEKNAKLAVGGLDSDELLIIKNQMNQEIAYWNFNLENACKIKAFYQRELEEKYIKSDEAVHQESSNGLKERFQQKKINLPVQITSKLCGELYGYLINFKEFQSQNSTSIAYRQMVVVVLRDLFLIQNVLTKQISQEVSFYSPEHVMKLATEYQIDLSPEEALKIATKTNSMIETYNHLVTLLKDGNPKR